MIKRLSYGLVVLSLLAACVEDLSVQGVRTDPAILELEIGQSERIEMKAWPSYARFDTPEWVCSDISVVIFDHSYDFSLFDHSYDKGTSTHIKGIAEGTCTVKVLVDGKSASCKVTVKKHVIPFDHMSLNKSSFELRKTDTKQLEAFLLPYDATETPQRYGTGYRPRSRRRHHNGPKRRFVRHLRGHRLGAWRFERGVGGPGPVGRLVHHGPGRSEAGRPRDLFRMGRSNEEELFRLVHLCLLQGIVQPFDQIQRRLQYGGDGFQEETRTLR